MALSTYVNVSITRASPSISRAGFGTPLLFGPTPTSFTDYVRTYNTSTILVDLIADGFAVTDRVYLAAAAIRDMDLAPRTIKVGRAPALTQVYHLIPANVTAGYVYSWTIGSESFTYTVPSSATVDIVVDGMVTAMAAKTGAWTPTASGGTATHLVITASATKTIFGIEVGGLNYDKATGLQVLDATADTLTDDHITAIREEDDDWYAFINVATFAKTTAALIGSTIGSERKVWFHTTQDSEVKDSAVTTDVMSVANTAGRKNGFILYHHLPHQFALPAVVADRLTYKPGEATYAFTAVQGTGTGTPKGFLSETQKTNIAEKGGNFFTPDAGVAFTFPGLATNADGEDSGMYIDLRIGEDWTYARIQEEVMLLYLSNAKVPFTDGGIQSIVGAIKSVLREGAGNGLFVPESIIVEAPSRASLSSAQRATRELPDVTFSAEFQGAIHKVTIVGTVSA